MGGERSRKAKSENGAEQKPSFSLSRAAAISSPLVGEAGRGVAPRLARFGAVDAFACICNDNDVRASVRPPIPTRPRKGGGGANGRRHLIAQLYAGSVEGAEKKLSQLVNFGAYPTTIYIGRDGLVKHIHAGFEGKATGERFTRLKAEMEALIEELLEPQMRSGG